MIYYVTTERFSSTIRRFLKYHGNALGGGIKSLTWEEIFFERGGPIGHYIFTDFDRLSRYELDAAAKFALALAKADPQAQILNHPLRMLERYPLLVKLNEAGINEFTATRLEAGARPPTFPVFIRAEDGYGAPDTDVLHDDSEFDAALEDLKRRALPLRGRIAIGYSAERGADGYFRKYAAFNVHGTIISAHLMRGRTWVVKNHINEKDWIERRDEKYRLSPESLDEELTYMRANPHSKILSEAFSIAGIDFGRADYGIVNGRVQVYEINTNPSLPGLPKTNARETQHSIMRSRLIEAIRSITVQITHSGRVNFDETRPRAHDMRFPRARLAAATGRKILSRMMRRPE